MLKLHLWLGAAIFLHGLIHLLGVVAYWRLARIATLPYKTAVASGRWELGDAGIRVFGGGFLLAGLALIAAGVGLALDAAWWRPLLVVATLLSLSLTALDWEVASAGAILDLLILAAVAAAAIAHR